MQQSKVFKGMKLGFGFLIVVMTVISGCSDNDKKSSSTGGEDAFEGALSGSTNIDLVTNKNTITVSWEKPLHETIAQENLQYIVYVSMTNNMTTLEDTLSNGFMMTSTVDEDQVSLRGFKNSTTYYITVVVADYDTEDEIAAFKSTSVVTGVGPVLTSFTVTSGSVVAVGSGLSADIWSATTPTYASSNNATAPCDFAEESSQSNLNSYFGTNGKTDTGWNPGSGDMTGVGSRCVALCDDFTSSPTSVCTNHVLSVEN